jgi:hypothetical protein
MQFWRDIVASDIEIYLTELRAALAGADPALVQDALFDAEEHLQSELAAGRAFTEIVDDYGTPREVAAAYLGEPAQTPVPSAFAQPGQSLPWAQTEPGATQSGAAQPGAATQPLPTGVQQGMRAAGTGPTPAASVWRQIFGPFVDGRVWTSLVYMLLSLATGITYFTVVVTGFSTAGGMLVLIIGIPLFMLVLAIVRGLALMEGRLVEALLGTRMPRRSRTTPPNYSFWQRMLFWLKDGRTWASALYMLLMLPLGVIYFTVAVTGVSVGLSLATAPIWGWFQWLYGSHTATINGVHYDFWPLWAIPIAFVAGVILLIAFMHLVKWIGRGHAAFAKAMLVRLDG